MVDIAQYISDLRETDALGRNIEEFLSVCVIPLETEKRPPIMANVKIKVLLPLDREVFATGTVIMHRADGVLVQLDSSINLEFLRQTLHEAIAAESGIRPAREVRNAGVADARAAAPQPSIPVPDKAPEEPPPPEPERPASPAENAPATRISAATGRIQGKVDITERFEIPVTQIKDKIAGKAGPKPEPPRGQTAGTPDKARKSGDRSETTDSYFQKPDELRPDSANADRADRQPEDFSISSISAVDSMTGQPIRPAQKKSPQEKTSPGFSVNDSARQLEDEFSRKSPAGSGDHTLKTPQEVTRRFFSPDTLKKARTEEVVSAKLSELMDGKAPVDELFSLAAEAGAIDIADSGLLDIPPRAEKTSPSNRGLSDEMEGTSPGGHTLRDGPTNASSSMPGTVDVTRMIQERTKPRFKRPDDMLPDDRDASPDAPDEQPIPDAGDKPEQAAEPENREMAVRIREMTSSEKQKLARQGKRVSRRILIRDNDKTIHKYVLFNPEVGLDEVIEYTRWNGLSAEAIEYITTNRQWMDSRDVIYNIVKNPSTPTEIAVRLVIKLSPNDWRMFVRPGVVKPAIMNQARKLLFDTEKKSQ